MSREERVLEDGSRAGDHELFTPIHKDACNTKDKWLCVAVYSFAAGFLCVVVSDPARDALLWWRVASTRAYDWHLRQRPPREAQDGTSPSKPDVASETESVEIVKT